MATIFMSLEGVRVKANSGKPRLLLRGRRRTTAIKMLQQLKVMSNQDWLESTRAAKNRYSPFLVLGAANSRFNTALGLLKARLEESLAAKA